MTKHQPNSLIWRYLIGFWRIRQRFSNQLMRRLEAEQKLDYREYIALQFIERGISYPGDLAEAMGIPSYLSSRVIEPLIAQGLIERQIDTSDARRIQLALSEQGRARLTASDSVLTLELDALLARLSPERRALLLEVIEQLADDPYQ